MLAGMHRAIRAFALAGNDVVVDDLCLEPSILEDYLEALEGLWVLFVAVRAPLEVVQAREDARPGRFPGTAYSHFDAVHAHGVYDLEVDTGAEGPEGCARQISSFIEAGLEPSAFDRLRQSGGARAQGVQP
jgi:chloramphenicol 3-O phosphotransferase